MAKKKTPIKLKANPLVIFTFISLILNIYLYSIYNQNVSKVNLLEQFKRDAENNQGLLPSGVAVDKVLNIESAKKTFCNNNNVMIWTDDLGTINSSWKVSIVQSRFDGNHWLEEYRVDKKTGAATIIP